MKVKKFISVFLVVALVVSMLVGCGISNNSDSLATSMNDSGDADTKKDVVSLRLVIFGDSTQRTVEFFENEFHDRILEELNIDLTVDEYSWGEYSQLAIMFAGGERFAAMGIYDPVAAAKGYYATIDEEMVNALAPNYLEMRETNGFEVAKYNGEIVTLPIGNKSYAGRAQFFLAREDILNEVGFKGSEIATYDQLMEAVAAVHAKYPEMRILGMENSCFLMDTLASTVSDELITSFKGNHPVYVYANELDDDDKIYSRFESEAFKNACEIAEEWQKLGYLNADQVSEPDAWRADWSVGNCLLRDGHPNSLVETQDVLVNVPGAELSLINVTGMPLRKNMNYDQALTISKADEDNVGRWLELIDWLYSDNEHYNFAINGIEGKDYEVENNRRVSLSGTEFVPGWWLESTDRHLYPEFVTDEVLNAYSHNDDNAVTTKMLGFTFDMTPVSSEFTSMEGVYKEYFVPMAYGLLNYEENYEEAIAKLKEAGLDTYMAEFQRQFSEWYSAQ